MSGRSTWTLVVIALGLFAYIFFFERHRHTGPVPPAPLLPGLEVNTVTALQVRPGGNADFITVERTNGGWQLTHPVLYPAEPHHVQQLLQALHSLTRQRQITRDQLLTHKDYHEEYGFTSPQFTLVIQEGESQLAPLVIGRTTGSGDEVFLQIVGSDGVYLASAALLQLLPRTANDWRERTLVPDQVTRVDRLMVTNGTRIMEFRRTNGMWRMHLPPPAGRADSPKIDQLLQQLMKLRITQFVTDDPKADLTAYGLRPAAFDLGLGQGTNVLVALSFGISPTNNPDEVYVRRQDLPAVELVSRQDIDDWKLPAVNFRDHQLLSFRPGAFNRIEVKGDGPFTLEQSSNQIWYVTSPERFPADTDLVHEFFGILNSLRIVDFPVYVPGDGDLLNYGLDKPFRTFILSKADTNAPNEETNVLQLNFGITSQYTNEVFVRRSDETPIYAISRADYDRQLPLAGWQLHDRRVWNFTTNEVNKMTVRHHGRVTEIVRDATGNWVVGPATTGALDNFNPLAVDYTLDSLGRLTAQGFWRDRDPQSLTNYHIADGSLTIEVELRGGDKPTILRTQIGSASPPTWPWAATRMDGHLWVFEFPPGTYLQVIQNGFDPAPDNL